MEGLVAVVFGVGRVVGEARCGVRCVYVFVCVFVCEYLTECW